MPDTPLIRETASDIRGENQEAAPWHEQERNRPSPPRFATQSDDGLHERHDRYDEKRRVRRPLSPDEKPGDDDGQIVEAEERNLIVDKGMDRGNRHEQQPHEQLLEVLDGKPFGTTLTDERHVGEYRRPIRGSAQFCNVLIRYRTLSAAMSVNDREPVCGGCRGRATLTDTI